VLIGQLAENLSDNLFGFTGCSAVADCDCGNMVLLGAAAPYLEIEFDELEKAIKAIFGRKGDAVVETNIKAIRAGRDAK